MKRFTLIFGSVLVAAILFAPQVKAVGDPHIEIIKRVLDPATGLYVDANNPPGPLYLVGTVVSYQLEVCNTGDVDLNPVSIDDAQLGFFGFYILAAGDCFIIDAGTNPELDSTTACADPGPFLNTATALAVGTPVDANDPAWVTCIDDPDSDGDGVPDADDICPGGDDNQDVDYDFVPDFCDVCPFDEFNDADGDGVCGDLDVCPDGDDLADSDLDGTPNSCDLCPDDFYNDADGDGICGDVDNCEVVSNPDQTDSDGDLFGDACDDDIDNDTVLNDEDNCPYDANSGQEDFDDDGVGDSCDADFDGDGVIDSDDLCISTMPGEAVDLSGCSIAEICVCSNKWKNHGAYVKCIAHTTKDFVKARLITKLEKGAIVSAAGQSACGHKK